VVLRALHLYLVLFQQVAVAAVLLIATHPHQAVLVAEVEKIMPQQGRRALVDKVTLVVLDFKVAVLALAAVVVEQGLLV